MALENTNYRKDEEGESLYWANPKLCQYTDVRVNFCGALCSNAWYAKKFEARRNLTQEDDQTAG